MKVYLSILRADFSVPLYKHSKRHNNARNVFQKLENTRAPISIDCAVRTETMQNGGLKWNIRGSGQCRRGGGCESDTNSTRLLRLLVPTDLKATTARQIAVPGKNSFYLQNHWRLPFDRKDILSVPTNNQSNSEETQTCGSVSELPPVGPPEGSIFRAALCDVMSSESESNTIFLLAELVLASYKILFHSNNFKIPLTHLSTICTSEEEIGN